MGLEPAVVAGPLVTAQGAKGGSSPGIIIGGKVRNRPMHSAAFTAGVDLRSQQCLRHIRFATGVVTADLQALWSCAAAGEMREKGRRARTSRAAG